MVSLNTRTPTAVLHQHLADMLVEEAVLAVMAEHSLNSYNTHCNDREIDRLKQATWVRGIVGGILKGGECIGRVPVGIQCMCAFLSNAASGVQS